MRSVSLEEDHQRDCSLPALAPKDRESTRQNRGRLQARRELSPEPATLISYFQPLKVRENTFLLFKPSLWYFVIAAPADQIVSEKIWLTFFYIILSARIQNLESRIMKPRQKARRGCYQTPNALTNPLMSHKSPQNFSIMIFMRKIENEV